MIVYHEIMHHNHSLMFTGRFDILGVYVEQVTAPKWPILVESLVQLLVKSTFSTRLAENEGLPVKKFLYLDGI